MIAALALSPGALAADSGPCQNLYRGIFDVDDKGQVHISKQAQGKFDIDTSGNKIKIRGRSAAEYGREIDIEKDAEGRASVIRDTVPSLMNTVGTFGLALMTLGNPETRLNYNGGACSVASIHHGKKLIVDARMCAGLVEMYRARGECAQRCDKGFNDKVKDVVTKYGGTLDEATATVKRFGLSADQIPTTQANLYLVKCASPIMAGFASAKPNQAPSPVPSPPPSTAQ